MKGDFTRDTFHPDKHHRQVLMQQGRVQLDADWNEQAAIAARRDETTLQDVAGDCGGPAEGAAFGVITSLADLTKVPPSIAAWFNALPAAEQARIHGALGKGDFLLSPGRYYVDGIQCELEQPILFSEQADLPGATLVANGANLLYLDVWQRHLTALEDRALLESALGGVDTATRVKTVWQVRALNLAGGIPPAACAASIPEYDKLTAPSTLRLQAQTQVVPDNSDPCQVPETVGYKGLENQLYRVEIHEVDTAGKPKQWKWSRENAAITSRLVSIDATNKKLFVESLGRGPSSDFARGQFVEILDDTIELAGGAGELIEIDDIEEARRAIVLKDKPTGAYNGTNPKVRRWEGVEPAATGWLKVDDGSGIEIQFSDLSSRCRVGDYWQIPARAATATSAGGDIEWPRNPNAQGQPDPANPIAVLPRGVEHHYGRLGFVTTVNGSPSQFTDCRCLWPSLNNVPQLFYVSGDGQEVMPDLTAPAETVFPLPQPLIVGVANGHCVSRPLKVRFTIQPKSTGRLVAAGGALAGATNEADVDVDANGLAACDFYLDGGNYSQRVKAQLLDASGNPVSLPILFNATLSLAAQVAYQPGDCDALKSVTTVQAALDTLCAALGEEHGCCCVPVDPNDHEHTLSKIIRELLAKAPTEICLCLLPGDHVVEEELRIAPESDKRPLHVTIRGCSPAARIVLKSGPLRAARLASFTLSDLELVAGFVIEQGRGAVECEACGEVRVAACRLGALTARGAVLVIRRANCVRVQNCFLEAAVVESLRPLVGLFAPAQVKFLGKPFAIPEGDRFARAALDAGAELAKLSPADRKSLTSLLEEMIGAKFEAELGHPPDFGRLTLGEFDSLSRLAASVSVESKEPAFFAGLLADVRTAAIKARGGIALVLGELARAAFTPIHLGAPADAGELVIVEHNRIHGTVALLDFPGSPGLSALPLSALAKQLQSRAVRLHSPQGGWQLRGNRLVRVVVAGVLVKQIAAVLQAGKGGINGAPGSFALSDNIIDGLECELVAGQLSLSGNKFTLQTSIPIHPAISAPGTAAVGSSVSDNATFVGNLGQTLPGEWPAAARRADQAANVDFQTNIL
ncbi:MAG: hypothetical protein EPO07_00310 [Verrucomicrobia bacterium]|nr:MAG: hypothetical protein EPO07_00310 [Verrucomicrobiota bacterium]